MKKLIALAIVAALVGLSTPAQAAKHWDDYSWWGNTGAKADPVADSKGRSGYWWWPTEAASNADDGELWGNRGVVYHVYAKAEEKAAEPTPGAAPQAPPAPAIVRDAISASVLFDFDKAILKPEGKLEVDKIVGELKKNAKDTIEVSGHTCNVGDDAYNMGLGQRRADAVKKYIVDSGIDAARVSTVSFGETKPAVPNDTAANRKLNRRAEFKTTPIN